MFLRLRHLTGFLSFSRKRKPKLKGRPLSHVIVTLDPNKFAEKKQKRFHISDQQCLTPHILLQKQSSPVKSGRLEYDTPNAVTGKLPSCPPGTKAFLYYSMSPERPRIAGELRLRVASSDDLASFESGSDLLLTIGQPWSRPLYSLSKYSSYSLLYKKLREERLVPDDLDTALSTLPSRIISYRRSIVLYTLNDTFIVDFSIPESILCVITEQGVERLKLPDAFSHHRRMRNRVPYAGSALVRFERSTLPDHKGTRTVVLRFLKIITPVKCVIPFYDGYVSCPKEGELHRRRIRNKSDSVWSVDIDDTTKSAMIRGLQLLWDA